MDLSGAVGLSRMRRGAPWQSLQTKQASHALGGGAGVTLGWASCARPAARRSKPRGSAPRIQEELHGGAPSSQTPWTASHTRP
jgi:hypothetical protein